MNVYTVQAIEDRFQSIPRPHAIYFDIVYGYEVDVVARTHFIRPLNHNK